MHEQADLQNWDPSFFMIRYNTAAVNRVCPLCGTRTDPAVGYALFFDDPESTGRIVCWECGRKYVPGLVAMLEWNRRQPDWWKG